MSSSEWLVYPSGGRSFYYYSIIIVELKKRNPNSWLYGIVIKSLLLLLCQSVYPFVVVGTGMLVVQGWEMGVPFSLYD